MAGPDDPARLVKRASNHLTYTASVFHQEEGGKGGTVGEGRGLKKYIFIKRAETVVDIAEPVEDMAGKVYENLQTDEHKE